MTILHILEAVAVSYVAGVVTGHAAVSFVKAQFDKLHAKLDQLLAKQKVNVFPKG